MIRKPKLHPVYGTNLVGISFSERWNVVQMATKEELNRFIANFNHIKEAKTNYRNNWDKNSTRQSYWEYKSSICDHQVQNNYLRRLWRKRYGETLTSDVIYQIDRKIARWNLKLAPAEHDGTASAWMFRTSGGFVHDDLRKGEFLLLTKRDEIGNLYFAKISEIDTKHQFVFSRDSAQIGNLVPIES